MAWKAYHVVLKLLSPMHIGCGKVGNLQRTRPYVTGRNLWGALTARLTRQAAQLAPSYDDYKKQGDRLHTGLACSYFFPTTDRNGVVACWPWEDEADFRYQFLSTYASTALNPTTSSAEDASLHEVECISPHTRDSGAPVYLSGYVFENGKDVSDGRAVFKHLQIGGERGYGWGRVTQINEPAPEEETAILFTPQHVAHLKGDHVQIEVATGAPLLAHTLAADFDEHPALSGNLVTGRIEPLVGRETRANTQFGQRMSRARICYPPGSRVIQAAWLRIGPYGIWEAAHASAQ